MGQVHNPTPLLDVYAAAIPPDLEVGSVCSPAREQLLRETAAPALKRQRFFVWHLLEFAAQHSLGLDPAAVAFRRLDTGRWVCPDFFFSLSHTEDAVAVAVSHGPVGVDVESLPVFARRYAAKPERCAAILRRIAAPGELSGCEGREAETLLRLWTGKESLFKFRGRDPFIPEETICGEETRHLLLELPPKVCLAISSEALPALRLFRYESGAVSPMPHTAQDLPGQAGENTACRP